MEFQSFVIRDNTTCVRIRGPSHVSTRTPVHFCVLIDISGSMTEESRLTYVKKSLETIITMLGKDDYISIITFNTSAQSIVTKTAVDESQREVIQHKIKGLIADGGTNMYDGFVESFKCLTNDLPTHKQGILVLTDGHTNGGPTDVPSFVSLIQSIRTRFSGTTVSCIGYGTTHNGELLRAIATEGSGSYNIVENLENVASVFGDILGGLVSCAYTRVVIEMPEGTTQLTKYPVDGSSIQIGDVLAGSDTTILLENCPVGKSIKIKGFNIKAGDFIEESVNVISTTDNEILRHGIITILRREIVELMERIRGLVASYSLRESRDEILREITRLDGVVQLNITTGGEHPILSLLKEELEDCKLTVNTNLNSHHLTEHATQILSQRVTMVNYGRGLRSMATPGRPNEVHASPAVNVFSNTVQRHISGAVRSATQAVAEADPVVSPTPSMPREEMEAMLEQALHDFDPENSIPLAQPSPIPLPSSQGIDEE